MLILEILVGWLEEMSIFRIFEASP